MTSAKFRTGLAGILVAGMALSGCSGADSVERGDANYENYTAEQIFERGEYDLARNNPDLAASVFAEVERL
ncbi:MAG: outer membrane protein assembly factor BamD, partial [Roseovarius indicus]